MGGKSIMLNAYNYFTGVIGRVSADYPRLPEHFGMNNGEFQHEQDRLRNESGHGVVCVDDVEKTIIDQQSSIMDGYVGSWEQWKYS